jgi:predicted hotdog family 3-hydroxylacyl-ACP dehydratase
MGVSDKIKSMDENIIELIPQKPPMVMIDKLIYSDDKRTETSFFIKEDNIFCEKGVFCEPGLIENIAQTAAARQGFLVKKGKSDVLIGYIGAIKNLKINFLPKINTEINTEIIIENEILGVTIIYGKVKCNDIVAAECEMKIFIENTS